MRIKRMRASFGKLKNQELRLGPGLNVIQAPNEAGKSTWCAFIRAMLYGVNTSERDKTGYLSDKTHFRPWDGGPMEGEMELTHGGKDITLTRTSSAASPMKNLTAVYTGTGLPAAGLEGADAGQALTGMSEKVFERTAFIRQASVRVSSDPELEKRISSLVSAGDEQLSYSQADGLLRKWRRAIEFKRSGELPRLEEELTESEAQMGRLQTLTVTTARADEQFRNFDRRTACFSEQLDQLDAYERYRAYLKAKIAADKADEADESVRTLRAGLLAGGREITRTDIAGLREQYAAAVARQSAAADATKAEAEARRALTEAETARDASPFAPLAPEDARKRASAAAEAAEDLRRPVWRFLLLPAAAAALLAAFLVSGLPAYVVGAAAAAVCLAVFFAAGSRYRKEAQRVQKLLEGFASPEALADGAEAYASQCAAAEAAREAYLAAAARLRAADTAWQAALTELKAASAVLCPDAAEDGIRAAIGSLERSADALSQARQQADALHRISDALGGRPAASVPETAKPDTDRAAAERNLRDAQVRRAEAERSLHMLEGELRACGDPLVTGSRIAELEERADVLRARCGALDLALDALRQANTELETRFSPVINREAAAILSRLTGGKYTRLTFTSEFEAAAAEGGSAVSRDGLYLSGGTLDQLYLALRLAMCRLLPAGEPCPIVLDDALANFDAARTKAALDCLRELAGERQILLFTCHEREAELLRGDGDVTILRL